MSFFGPFSGIDPNSFRLDYFMGWLHGSSSSAHLHFFRLRKLLPGTLTTLALWSQQSGPVDSELRSIQLWNEMIVSPFLTGLIFITDSLGVPVNSLQGRENEFPHN